MRIERSSAEKFLVTFGLPLGFLTLAEAADGEDGQVAIEALDLGK